LRKLKGMVIIMVKFSDFIKKNEWADKTLLTMTIDEKIGQLLHPCVRPDKNTENIWDVIKLDHLLKDQNIKPGGIFIFPGEKQDVKACVKKIQDLMEIPALISADLEIGAGNSLKGATEFSCSMAVTAANNEDYAYVVGKSSALEGRECGINWTFGPVVDVNMNKNNPVVNIRSLGDDPDTVAKYASLIMSGIQDNGMVATAKHFPGDGIDDRDQHICTTINSLSMDKWYRTSGKVFKDLIDAGVWSIMTGHIALPAYDKGDETTLSVPPATLSYKITTKLLREELGFEGLIITDAVNMGGMISQATPDECVLQAIEAGCDMLLFINILMDLEKAFYTIKNAVLNGRISEERIDQSVRRILIMKEILGLHKSISYPSVKDSDMIEFKKACENIAKDAITLVCDKKSYLPLKLTDASKVISINMSRSFDLCKGFSEKRLNEQGITVTSYNETQFDELPSPWQVNSYDAMLMNFYYQPGWANNLIRPGGVMMQKIFELLYKVEIPLIVISYGSPYIVHEFPKVSTILNAYYNDEITQNAVVDILLGKSVAKGISPVRLLE
jgi:beta-N-acetylhexosaminidase